MISDCWRYLLLFTATFAAAQEITVAAAADMSSVLPQIVAAYTEKTGQSVKLSFGASGSLTNQIENGAPFDIFFSADEQYPQQLIKEELALKETLYRYAVGQLVLWIPADSPLVLSELGINTLLDPSIKKIAIANPATAPYGRAAEATLRHFGIYDQGFQPPGRGREHRAGCAVRRNGQCSGRTDCALPRCCTRA
jgi:molybdate transport system substrate-binding protein